MLTNKLDICDPYKLEKELMKVFNSELELTIKFLRYCNEDVLLYEKRINDKVGYIMVICSVQLSVNHFKKLYNSYITYVRSQLNGRYRDVEMILVGSKIDDELNRTVKKYNELYGSIRKKILLLKVEI